MSAGIKRKAVNGFTSVRIFLCVCVQFMFGDRFLAAPVVDRGVTKWNVYLPVYSSDFGSRWLDVWSNFQVM